MPTTAADAVPRARREVRQRACGPREVDQDVGIPQTAASMSDADRHAGRAAEALAGIAAEHRAAGDVERAGRA